MYDSTPELSLLTQGLMPSAGFLRNKFLFGQFVAWVYVDSFVSNADFNYSRLDHGQNNYTAGYSVALSAPI